MADYNKVVKAKDALMNSLRDLTDELGVVAASDTVCAFGRELGLSLYSLTPEKKVTHTESQTSITNKSSPHFVLFDFTDKRKQGE